MVWVDSSWDYGVFFEVWFGGALGFWGGALGVWVDDLG